MDKGNKITYETLFDILRNEKNREELQALDKSFFPDIIEYLQDKEKLVKDNSDDQLFSSIEREKTMKQLENAKKLLKELYERREKKIINIAMISTRTGGILDKSALLPEEEQLFERISSVLESFKNDILYRLLGGLLPEIKAQSGPGQAVSSDPGARLKKNPALPPGKDTLMVRFTHAVPKFIGKELEIFGPYEEEDVANLPKQIAEILITKGRAELIQA